MDGLEQELLRNFQEAVRLAATALTFSVPPGTLLLPTRLLLTRAGSAQGVFEFAAELGIIEQGTAIDEIGAPHLVSTQNARQPDVARGPSGSGRLAAADGDPRGCVRSCGGPCVPRAHLSPAASQLQRPPWALRSRQRRRRRCSCISGSVRTRCVKEALPWGSD